jgi:epoxyqueuosine reductase
MKESIRSRALELGFDDCRFTSAEPPATGSALLEWLDSGQHGEMLWLQRNAFKRTEPKQVLQNAQSVIALAISYAREQQPSTKAPKMRGIVARYAQHADYHDVLSGKLKELTGFVNAQGGPETRSLCYVDTGPILERDLAQRAGLGFVGKHTGLISPRLGNWFLIAEILTTLRLEPDQPGTNRCGSCVRCIHACPTRAITAPFKLDARRCISYLTIELKGSIPEEFRPAIGNRIFGCDDCLAACPWNRFAREGAIMKEHARADLSAPELIELLSLDEAGFKAKFAGTPLYRTKRRGVLRNVCVALGNIGDAQCLPALNKAAQDPEPLIAEHAEWAIKRVQERCGSLVSQASE